jgi:acetyltransferase-like isoleucine patch superfamily enzyme
MKLLILKIVRIIRKEEVELGDFSGRDLMRIIFGRIICLLRGFFFINIPGLRKGIFFIGGGSKIKGREKIIFNSSTTIGSRVKISAIGSKRFEFGKNFSIRDLSIIDAFGSIKKDSGQLLVGNNVGISENCYFAIRGNLTIGNDVIFGPAVRVFTENHSMEINDLPFRLQEEIRSDVVIGNNVWIGAGAFILPGVIIGDNAVVAAGSVVNRSVESGTIVGGVPAKFLKSLK